MSKDFDPYQSWLSIPPEQQPPDYYCLLGINRYEPSLKIIERAVNQRVELLQNLSNGPNVKHAQRVLNEIAKARVCLTDPVKKSAYDRQLQNPKSSQVVQSPKKDRNSPVSENLPNINPAPAVKTQSEPSKKPVGQKTQKTKPQVTKKKQVPVVAITAIGLGGLLVVGLVVTLIIISMQPSAAQKNEGKKSAVAKPKRQKPSKPKTADGQPTPPKFAPGKFPAAITNRDLVLWLDASQQECFRFGRGNKIRWWLDKSGNNNHAGQVKSSNQPLLEANQLNGLPTVTFSTARKQWFEIENENAFDFGKTVTMIYVVRHSNGILLSKGTASQVRGFSIYRSPTTFRVRNTRDKDKRFKAADVPQDFTVISLNFDANSLKKLNWRINGKPNKTNNITQADLIELSNAEPLRIGKRGFRPNPSLPAFYFDGQLGELLIYRRSLNSDEIQKIENHLLQKWKL